MRPMTMLPLKSLCLAFLPLILTAPVAARAKPHAKARRIQAHPAQTNLAQTIHQQFAAKDATIAELRRQIRALTGQVAALNARLEDMRTAGPSDLGALTTQVQNYNSLLTDARTDAVEVQKNDALQQAAGNGSADRRRYAAKEGAALATMKKSLLQAQGLYGKITASPLYESHFFETDPAVKVGETPHSLAFDTVGETVHLRFIQPR